MINSLNLKYHSVCEIGSGNGHKVSLFQSIVKEACGYEPSKYFSDFGKKHAFLGQKYFDIWLLRGRVLTCDENWQNFVGNSAEIWWNGWLAEWVAGSADLAFFLIFGAAPAPKIEKMI